MYSSEEKAAHAETKRLRALIERPEQCRFWGQPYTITPRLIAHVFGDGQQLLCVTPLATRPNYFVVRVDSSSKSPLDGEIALIDLIMDEQESEYGTFGDEEELDASGDDPRPFPIVDWGIGATWGKSFPIGEWKPTKDARYPTRRSRTRARWRRQGRRG